MYEAIQFGCIPIYISDEFWLPFSNKIEWEKLRIEEELYTKAKGKGRPSKDGTSMRL